MILIDGVKYACERCVRGHRVSSCQHADQPLTMIKPKGRPTSQCTHCREHRKSKQLHTKCHCGGGKSPHANTCPCAFDADLCTCAKKTSGHNSSSSIRRTSSNPPTSSRLHTPGGHTTHTGTHHSNGNSPVVRSASTTSLASAGAKSRSASRSRGRSNTTALIGSSSASSGSMLANIAPRRARTDISQPPPHAAPPAPQRLSNGFDSLDEMFGNSVSAGAPYHLPIHSSNSSSYNGNSSSSSAIPQPPPAPPHQPISGAATPSSVQSAFNFPPVDTSNVPFFLDDVDFSTSAAAPSSLYETSNGAMSDFDTLTLPSDGEYRVDDGSVFLSSMGDLSDNNNNDVNVITTNTNSIKLLSTTASASSEMLNSTMGVYGQQQQQQQQQQLQFPMAAATASGSGNDFLYDFDWSSAGRS